MLPEALPTIARMKSQTRWPSAEEWAKKMWYVYAREYYSARQKDKIPWFTRKKMDGIYFIKAKLRKTSIMEHHICSIGKTKTQQYKAGC